MGDFNEILHLGEKVGGKLQLELQMNNFNATINRNKLRDLGYIGANYTWSRKLGERGWVREHLDRALVSSDWLTLFPKVRLYHVFVPQNSLDWTECSSKRKIVQV